jgi:hypothetical protein
VQLVLNEVQGEFALQVLDVTGRELMNSKVNNTNYEIPVGQLADGLYFVRVSDGLGGVGVRVLVKE